MESQDFSLEKKIDHKKIVYNDKTCQICNLENPEPAHYYKTHKITQKFYYEKYFPQWNLLTGKKMEFKKNIDSYFLNSFDNKNELKEYLKSLTEDARIAFCKNLIINRIAQKNIKYTLGEVECRSLLMPNVQYLDTLFKKQGGYYSTCAQLGLINKFETYDEILGEEFDNNINRIIYVDTREQTPLNLPNIEIKTLPYGDYTIDNSLYIERKSLSDFITSFGVNINRLDNEINKAKKNGAYIVVLVEENINRCLAFNKLSWIKFVKATPEFIFHNIRELLQKYDNFQFVFADGTKEAIRLAQKILYNPNVIKYDVEYLYSRIRML